MSSPYRAEHMKRVHFLGLLSLLLLQKGSHALLLSLEAAQGNVARSKAAQPPSAQVAFYMKGARVLPKPDVDQRSKNAQDAKHGEGDAQPDPGDVFATPDTSTTSVFPPEDKLLAYDAEGKAKKFPVWARCLVSGTGVLAVMALVYFYPRKQPVTL
ncbi:unnamed protein product [Prorocentrum cordatum]|uniref:Transmembrane protein n=1 Tax=Prorocentrum cordatum TaxID=2364126 RepID=A0ABN9VM78_9DINO|nr:unnamed protein product [Polarella glacialis]|mmetsp:Transcript_24818/g.65394  ORF Transcript_24818/g.65394 Transcript_24818/m.65394 type:complete len:156 (+) Transcript_24818:57-524(+)